MLQKRPAPHRGKNPLRRRQKTNPPEVKQMCGRYYIEIDDKELEEITKKVQERLREEENQLTIKLAGEIFPSEIVPVQVGMDTFAPMKWGFSGFDGRALINARSETAHKKKIFADSLRERRCVIPASGYYEWQKTNGGKLKHRFYVPDRTLHLAGCWRLEGDAPVFVIFTREAVGAARAVHERMPVIIPGSRVNEWLCESPEVMRDAVTELTVEAVA